jgi:hypothetical protein
MLLRYFLNDFEMVPVAPIITGITFVLNIPYALYFCCKLFILYNLLGFIIIIIIISSSSRNEVRPLLTCYQLLSRQE